MRKPLLVFAMAAVVLLGAMPLRAAGQAQVVEGLLFYSETCPHCRAVIDEFLPKMQEKYGDRVSIELVSVQDPLAYAILLELDGLYGVPEDQRGGVPELFIGSSVMIGRYSIEDSFEKVVDEYLAKGGANMPSFAEMREKALAAQSTAQAPTQAASQESRAVVAAYFYKEGCQECERAQYDLRLLQERYPQFVLESYAAAEQAPMLEWLGERYGVPEAKRLASPAFFVGQDYLLGADVNLARMEALLQKYSASGSASSWQGWKAQESAAEGELIARYRSFGFFTLVAAGLIDGVNPCAFATLLFLVSYLAVTGQGRRQVLLAGGAFTFGVFITYMALGFGLYQLVSVLTRFSIVAKVLYGITAAVALVLAGLSLHDFVQARRGDTSAMALRLPTRLRRWINATIRERVRPGTTALAALAVGVVVSGVELVCTGQVYLPTIMFVASRPELRVSALGALTLYNLAFILPLVGVFAFAAYGTGSQKLHGLLGKHTSAIKLLTAAVLVGLAIWLIIQL